MRGVRTVIFLFNCGKLRSYFLLPVLDRKFSVIPRECSNRWPVRDFTIGWENNSGRSAAQRGRKERYFSKPVHKTDTVASYYRTSLCAESCLVLSATAACYEYTQTKRKQKRIEETESANVCRKSAMFPNKTQHQWSSKQAHPLDCSQNNPPLG